MELQRKWFQLMNQYNVFMYIICNMSIQLNEPVYLPFYMYCWNKPSETMQDLMGCFKIFDSNEILSNCYYSILWNVIIINVYFLVLIFLNENKFGRLLEFATHRRSAKSKYSKLVSRQSKFRSVILISELIFTNSLMISINWMNKGKIIGFVLLIWYLKEIYLLTSLFDNFFSVTALITFGKIERCSYTL